MKILDEALLAGAAALTFLLILPGRAAPFVASGGKGAGPAGIRLADQQVVYHDTNSVLLAEANTGQIGIDVFSNNGAGFFLRGTRNNYVFGSGIWIAGIGDVDADGGQDTLFVQSYDPLSGGTEYREGKHTQDTSDPLARLFKSTVPEDLEAWPDEFRFVDPDTGSPTYGQRIPKVFSAQDIVGIYTTVGKPPLFATPSPPLEVRQRGMAFTTGILAQAIIFVLDVRNISDEVGSPVEMHDAWLGFDADMDIGDEFADDRTSVIERQITPEGDTIQVDMGLAWDESFGETNFTGTPGFIGIAYLQSPGNAFDGVDNDGDGTIDESPFDGVDDDGDGIIDDQPDEVDQLGLVNYTFHNNPSVPGPREDPQDDNQGYRIMACTPPEECVETADSSDVRFLIDSGPFQILPGETHRLVIAFVFANTSDPEIDSLPVVGDPPRPDPNHPALAELLTVRAAVQEIFDQSGGFVGIGGHPGVSGPSLPRDLALLPNTPNPFSGSTLIRYLLPQGRGGATPLGIETPTVPHRLAIFDLRGRLRRTLAAGPSSPGEHRAYWDGRDDRGALVGSGVYMARLEAGPSRTVRKLVVAR